MSVHTTVLTAPARPLASAAAPRQPLPEPSRTPQDPVSAPQTPVLTTTVPRQFVHRAALAEVLLSDWSARDGGGFTVTAQWPRRHSFFALPEDTHYDPLLIAETIRQAGTLLAHTELGVPLGHQFLMSELSVSVLPERLRIPAAPDTVALEVTHEAVQERRGQHVGAGYRVVLRIGGRTVATGGAAYTCISPRAYGRLRASAGGEAAPLTSPVPPQHVGRLSPRDVVLSPAGRGDAWTLRVDTRHPVLFDHPVDHVPGMLLAEAARQAATAALGPGSVVLSLTARYGRYVELDVPCRVTARVTGSSPAESTVLVTAAQQGAEAFHAVVTARPRPC
ncbi:adhesin [Streptomyces griseomycini]|uniref:ScbA/BarX family gamma-butyrolactone biosynthesis protein n=1 Tax=Streptomyces griseomycini TaxID=66895 RepID=UPI001877256B|nr:ScbA/BarX family gamma-butyrolactone biosynthesis protein [Streptomyces griseomycini]GGQ39497.1 adhesin [Streptomyces griseomycini]